VSKIEVKLNPDVKPAGSDLSIVNAARRSFNTRSEWDWSCVRGCTGPNVPCSKECHRVNEELRNHTLKPKDKRLLEFLARGMTADDFKKFKQDVIADSWYTCEWEGERDVTGEAQSLVEQLWSWRNTPTHDTPFNHTFISFEVQAPIFVRAQLVKHEYLILSEFSRRYITDNVEFYTPDYWRKEAPNKKQGSLDEAVTSYSRPFAMQRELLETYLSMIQEGVAPEQARMVLPQSTMTEWTWSGTLGAFAKMCTLRLHPEAQYEARLVAQQVYEYLKEYWPVGAKALVEGPDV
jgi:thymidylate synthase (FAD)